MPQSLKMLLQRCSELNHRDEMVRQFFRPSSAGPSKQPRHRFSRDLDPSDVAVKHESKAKTPDPTRGSRPSSALERSPSPPSPAHNQATAAASSSFSGAFGGNPAAPELLSARINWGTTVETSLAAINGGAGNNEDALQRLLAAKRSALMQRLDPDGQYEAAILQVQVQSSPLHNRALSPTKDRLSSSKMAPPLQRRMSVRPASAAAMYSGQNGLANDGLVSESYEENDREALDDGSQQLTPSALASPAASLPPHQQAASSPAARRLERFAFVDAHVSHTIDQMHAQTQMAAAAPGELEFQSNVPAHSRPSSAASSRSLVGSIDQETDDRADRADMYFLQVQVDNSTCGFADRFDCVVMTHDLNCERRQLTASFPQLLMSKDRYLLFAAKPKMWQGLPTDKVFGSGVARMTDFDPRTVLSLSEFLPWVTQPSQLLGKSLRVQVFSRVKRDNARRCVVDKLITFNPDFTVDTREFPESIKGLRDGQRAGSGASKQRPRSAMC